MESTLLLNRVFICICIRSDLQHDQAVCSVLSLLCEREGKGDVTGMNACVTSSCTVYSYLDANGSDLGTVLCAKETENAITESMTDT